MKSALPSRKDIEALVAYLSRLYADGLKPILRWDGGERQKDGSITMPWPVYDPVVEEFFIKGITGCWIDYDYRPEEAWRMLKDEELVQRSTLDQIKTMLTFCDRGERFSDGHWAAMIEEGHIRRLLERLKVILSTEFDAAEQDR